MEQNSQIFLSLRFAAIVLVLGVWMCEGLFDREELKKAASPGSASAAPVGVQDAAKRNAAWSTQVIFVQQTVKSVAGVGAICTAENETT
ncbi:hypothetical protein MTO96_043850, partial [Rhipicephalus appendiculatus]